MPSPAFSAVKPFAAMRVSEEALLAIYTEFVVDARAKHCYNTKRANCPHAPVWLPSLVITFNFLVRLVPRSPDSAD